MTECYNDILSRRSGEREALPEILPEEYRRRLKGAFFGRMAGCTLGAPVEGWTLEQIDAYAKETGMTSPYSDYWPSIPDPDRVRYIVQTFGDYTRGRINGVPADDDVGYTILSYLMVKEHGRNFTLADVAEVWQKYITESYTAEAVAMQNLANGIAPEHAAEVNNEYSDLMARIYALTAMHICRPVTPKRRCGWRTPMHIFPTAERASTARCILPPRFPLRLPRTT